MKRTFKKHIVFVSYQRTPFGTFLGSLSDISAIDLGTYAAKFALIKAGLSPKLIDHVIFGNVLSTSSDSIYLARHIGLKSEIPIHTPAITINRLCGSGFEAVIQGARLIECDEANAVLVGGTENLSQSPHIIRGARKGLNLAQCALEDSLWTSLTDSFINMSMAMTAENLGEIYKISQEEVDLFSLRSQQKYDQAFKKGIFEEEIAKINFINKNKTISLDHDEHPRPNTSLEVLKKLPKIFKKDGLIHAGAASGISDGACALIMCSKEFADNHGLKVMGELISFGISGCDPKIMGIGPVPAIKKCLENSELSLDDMDMIEINEAFAPQVLAVKKELNLDDNKLNINGGAIAVGHPLAASGARITGHILLSLKREKAQFGLGSACIGGGQGIAVILKSVA